MSNNNLTSAQNSLTALNHDADYNAWITELKRRYMHKFYLHYAQRVENLPQAVEDLGIPNRPQAADDLKIEELFSISWYHHRRIIDKCKDKDNVAAQYALDGYSQPLGISQYELEHLMPKNFKPSLPTIEEIESELEK